MWYFTWILGIGVALGFGIINVMWLEAQDTFGKSGERPDASPPQKAPARPESSSRA
ncbi:cytochrome bd-I oxidase subunit CydX [Paraburkholderia hayleyella]|uniref:cytochrome bd-I oxidase subunit CydX n=1 Tax=Paraburkholderia hayleyella TaxID=2152889 RepID=UPI001290ACAD|nr:cytochrome bd-I oxidase subunit CydX [Paraburkholderia hayleyella]